MGVAAVETAVVLPVLLIVLLGIMDMGLLFNNYISLTNAVRVTSRILASSRGSSTPYSTATADGYASAPNLTQSKISLTLTVAGTACTADGACATALSSNAGNTSSVTGTYPCNPSNPGGSITFMGVTIIPSCTLSSSTTERIE
jgi:Flp pilus assembly protein TadG